MNIDQLIEVALDNQPLLKKNQADIQSSDLGVSLATANYYPRVSIWYQTGRSHSDLEKIYSDFDQNYWNAYGLSINWNLFNGRSDYINRQKAILDKKMTMEYDVNYKRELKSRIKGYYDNYKSYEEIIEINEENLEAAKEELRLAEERYQIGAGTSLEVREAQVKLTRAEETLIAAQYNAMITLAQLDNELGLSEKKLNEQ
jgi:outer membrane protein TolC